MKTKRDQYKKERGRMLSALLAFVLAFGLAVAAPSLEGPALAADPSTLAGGTDGGQDGGGQTQQEGGQAGDTAGPQPGAALDLEALKGQCSLTLQFPKQGNVIGALVDPPADLEQLGLVVDVYKIADAVKKPGYQTYQFRVSEDSPYAGVIDTLLSDKEIGEGWSKTTDTDGGILFYYAPNPEAPKPADARSWSDFVDALARVCLPKSSGIDPNPKDQPFGAKIEGLDPGLYLTVVHGALPEDSFIMDDGDQYKEPVDQVFKNFDHPSYITEQMLLGPDGMPEVRLDNSYYTDLAGTAYDEKYIYLFQPQLVSLPGYAVEGEPPTAVPNSAAQNGRWMPDVTIYTKHGAKPRYIDLQIVKKLPRYLAGEDSVTFVYEISYKDEAGQVQVMYESISFSGPSANGKETRIIVDRIPVGVDVTVTEIYAGYAYDLTSVIAEYKANSAAQGGGSWNLAPNLEKRSITIPGEGIQPGSIQLTIPEQTGTVRLDDGYTQVVVFENELNNNNKGGGSVVNSFSGVGGNGWTWTKRSYVPGQDGAPGKWETVESDSWSMPFTQAGN